MRDYSNEIKGTGRQVKGKIEEEAGDLLDDRGMQIEGKVEKNMGKMQRGMGRAARHISESMGTDRSSHPSDSDLDVMDEDELDYEELEEIGPGRRR